MLHYETLDPATLRLLKSLQSFPFLEQTRLVDGTALALQLGHRKSVDLDLFGVVSVTGDEMKSLLSPEHKLMTIKESQNINIF